MENKDVTAPFELPSLNKEDVQIDIHNNRMTVSGDSKSTVSAKKALMLSVSDATASSRAPCSCLGA